jgi:C-terminal processing protease CtpA/Prc
LKVTREKIFNTSVLETKEWASFEKDIKRVSKDMQDDLEMEFAFFYFAGKLPFSHYFLLRPDPGSNQQVDSTVTEKQVSLEEKSPGTMYMKIESFAGTAVEMDSVFSYIIKKNYKNLVVDLRNNSGGSVEAGMRFATLVADTPFYGGVFLTQNWFADNKQPPAIREYDKLPAFTESNFHLLINGIHDQKGLCLKIVPEQNTYKGNLFILTSNVTASTCEPIVYGLKQRKRALIVGERTAGAMLNGEFFKLKDGFSLMIPTADYYTSDGYRIDQKGVEPSITVKQAEALNYVMQNLIR